MPTLDSGYRNCACRDCFEIAIGEPGALCSECEEAGCEAGTEQECQAPNAYGQGEDEESAPLWHAEDLTGFPVKG